MTDFRVQKLFVPNCEEEIEQNYYDWGRKKDERDKPDPSWALASSEQRRAVALRGYAVYDGCPAVPGNEIGATEAWVSAGFRSRVIEFDVVRFLSRADEAIDLLAMIPDQETLADSTDDQISAAAQLIELFAEAPHIGRGKATKVLHKKRPAFMPVLDSVIDDFLWKNFPYRMSEGSPASHRLLLCREMLRACLEPVRQVRTNLAAKGFPLTEVRVFDFMLWTGWCQRTDTSGIGIPIRRLWQAPSLAEAKAKARALWDETVQQGTPGR